MNIETFYPYVTPEVPGCPEPLIRQALVSAATEFCTDSLSWNAVESVVMTTGVSEYELDFPSQSYIIAHRNVYVDGRLLKPVPRIVGSETGAPFVYTSPELSVIQVYPTPIAAGTLSAECVYVPTPDATTLPNFMIQYLTAIAGGAKAALMVMPKVEWSNPQLSVFYRQMLLEGINKARIKSEFGGNPGSLTVKPRAIV